MAAPVVVRSGNFIEVTAITEDVSAFQIFAGDNAHPEGKKITRMEFVAGSNNDKCVIKETDENGATITTLASADVELVDRVYFYGGMWMMPFIDFDKGTFNTGHKLVIELE